MLQEQGVRGTVVGMSTPRRERFIFNCPERLRRAIIIRAGKKGLRPAEIVPKLLEAALTDELSIVDEEMKQDNPAPPSPKGRSRKRSD